MAGIMRKDLPVEVGNIDGFMVLGRHGGTSMRVGSFAPYSSAHESDPQATRLPLEVGRAIYSFTRH